MKKHTLKAILVGGLSFSMLTGFGLKEMSDKVGGTKGDKCDKAKDKSKCKRDERLKQGATVVAIGIAAQIINDLVIEYKSKAVKTDTTINDEYKAKHKQLPDNPTVLSYTSSLNPGKIVNMGKPTEVKSKLAVVRGKKSESVIIEEKIEFYDNEQTDSVIKSFAKVVNAETKQAGEFENSFSFTLPVGMPQGIYRIETAVLIDGKQYQTTSNDMQVVMQVFDDHSYQIVLR